MLENQLAQDAPNRPHLDGRVVFGLHEDEFGGPVPAADHMDRHLLLGFLRLRSERTLIGDGGSGYFLFFLCHFGDGLREVEFVGVGTSQSEIADLDVEIGI